VVRAHTLAWERKYSHYPITHNLRRQQGGNKKELLSTPRRENWWGPTSLSSLAVLQRKGGVSGKELLTAIILGVDLVCRVGVSLPIHPGRHISSTYGIFGVALAAGKILGLTPEALTNACGIASSQAAGTRHGRLEGTLTKRLQPALACQSGVLAALIFKMR